MDAKNPPDKAQLMLSREALYWLPADLASNAQNLESEGDSARRSVPREPQHWLEDSDLISVRDPATLTRLPDDEREHWQELWRDVPTMLARVATK